MDVGALEISGYALALLIGVSLGLIGGGGSILTFPVLTYFLGVNAVTATAYSLFIVRTTALIGMLKLNRRGMVNFRIGLIFAIPSFIAVWITRAYVIPAIPNTMLSWDDWILTKDLFLTFLFSILMLIASISMIRRKSPEPADDTHKSLNYIRIMTDGLVVGVITGLVGAGGGFLIIPALVFLTGLDMKTAVGTSLLIITMKSLIGFTGDLTNEEIYFDWVMLLSFTAIAIGGIFIGARLSKIVSGAQLKRIFGWTVFLLGLFMIVDKSMDI